MSDLICAVTCALRQLERMLRLQGDELERRRGGSWISDEDHGRLLAMVARGKRLAGRLTRFAAALKTLDDSTPNSQ